jgi:hypothetical protein
MNGRRSLKAKAEGVCSTRPLPGFATLASQPVRGLTVRASGGP